MKRYLLVSSMAILAILVAWKGEEYTNNWGKETPLSEVMVSLGEEKPLHYRDIKDEQLIQRGYELITKGRTTDPNGKKSNIISKHFMCTDCHNIQREDPDLRVSDPEKRLDYAIKNEIPFLQGTTLWGIVNRRSWYNDDYIKKYGDLVLPTNDTLVNAIQLCTDVCSQGRRVDDWEIDAMLAYFYSIQITLGDLNLSEEELSELNSTQGKSQEKIDFLRTKYLTYSPATFLEPRYGDDRNYGEKGNPENGKEIFNRSCMHCHHGNGVTNMTLHNDKLDFRFLERHMSSNSNKSIYVISRRGTYAKPSYKPYMPLYTLERMSEQQLEDLAAYIKSN